jgi:hypothetical protein
MAVSPWSAPVTTTTLPAAVTLAPANASQANRASTPDLTSSSGWAGPVTATTLAGAPTLAVTNAAQANAADSATGTGVTLTGFGEGGFGTGGFGGSTTSGRVIVLTVVAAPVPPAPIVVVEPTDLGKPPAAWAWVAGPWNVGPTTLLSQARSRRVTWRLTGRSDASFEIDGTDQAAAAIDELISDLWVLRSPVPNVTAALFRGRLGNSGDEIDATAHTSTFQAGDYRAILDARFILPSDLSILNTDQGQIAWQLIQNTQGQTGGNLGIVQGNGLTTGVLRDRSDYPAGKKIGEALDQLSQVDNGFDYDIRPAADPRDLTLFLDVYYPARGTDRQAVLRLGDRVVKVQRTVDVSEYANAERGTGAEQTSTGTALNPVLRTAPDLATRPEGRWDGQMADPDLTVQQTIVDKTVRALADSQVIVPAYVLTLKPNDWGGPDDIWLGDPALTVIQSGRVNVVESLRVTEIAATWDDETDDVTAAITVAAIARPGKRWRLRRVDQRLQKLERR